MSDRKRKTRDPGGGGVSRRDFLTTAGLGTVGLAAASEAASAAAEIVTTAEVAAGELVPARLHVNGFEHRLLVEARWSLAYILREKLGITGTKMGCDRGECGSCTVLLDGTPRYACMTLVLEAEGRQITTLEGLLVGEELGEVQQAFLANDAFQCGYCTPGQIMAVEGLLRANPDPSMDEIRVGVSGNLCRCGAYVNIFKAARQASLLKHDRGGGA